MTKKLTGTEPYQTPLNADLGTLAYQDKENIHVNKAVIGDLHQHIGDEMLAIHTTIAGKDYIRGQNSLGINNFSVGNLSSDDSYISLLDDQGNQTFLHRTDSATKTTLAGHLSMTDGNIVFASGKGIDFSATANGSGTTSSEILDDYEEGTWVPTFGADGSNPTMTYNAQVGRYTKIGNLVTAYCQIITATRSGGSGMLTVDGLPFTVAPAVAFASATIGFNYNWNTPPLNAGAQGGQTHVILYQDARINAGATPVDIVASGSSYFYFVVSYETTL